MEERITLFSHLPFHIGIKSMEKSILDVDEAIVDFCSCNFPTKIPMKLCSWKFPHLLIENVHIRDILKNLQNHNFTGDVQYLHLVELLIDRIYFFILTSVRFTSTLISIVSGSNTLDYEQELQGISVSNPLRSDPNVLNTNMALIIRHHQSLSKDLEHLIKNLLKKVRSSELHEIEYSGNDLASSIKKRCCSTQTNIGSIECCEVCSMGQETIRKIGEKFEGLINQISPKEITFVAAIRQDISKNLFTMTQWSAVTRWCEALMADADFIVRSGQEYFEKNLVLEKEIKKLTQLQNTNVRDHQIAIQKLEKKYTRIDGQLQAKIKEKTELTEMNQLLKTKIQEVELVLTKREDELKTKKEEKDALQKSYQTLDRSYQDLKYSQATHSQTLCRIQQDLLAEQKYKETVQSNMLSLENSNRKHRLEIAKLKSDYSSLKDEKTKADIKIKSLNDELTTLSETIKKQYDSEISKLKDELKLAAQKMEILTLYPDLNGPINAPESDKEDPIQAIENQLKGNTTRVQVLLQQSEKLACTLKKLKDSKT